MDLLPAHFSLVSWRASFVQARRTTCRFTPVGLAFCLWDLSGVLNESWPTTWTDDPRCPFQAEQLASQFTCVKAGSSCDYLPHPA